MEKLEHYLDQVCRCMGGSRSLRQHVRQELREHLLDAVAQNQAAGLSQHDALDRALEQFGKPEEVRSELESAHGQRLLPVLVDKAMQWKEMTMRAKWLWMSWAHLSLALVIALELIFITFIVIFIVPKFQVLLRDGVLDPAILTEPGWSWMPGFLEDLSSLTDHYTTWLLVLAVAAVGVFEWRVKSENKAFIRLSALGTAAVGLMVVLIVTSGALVISFCLGVPATARLARPFALDQLAKIDASISALQQAQQNADWQTMQEQADRAAQAMDSLAKAGPAIPSLTVRNQTPTGTELRAHWKVAYETLAEAQQAIHVKDAPRLETALHKFRKSFEPLPEAAKRSSR